MGYLNFVVFPLDRFEGDTAEVGVLELDGFVFSSLYSVQIKNRIASIAL